MKLTAYRLPHSRGWELKPAPRDRPWMDQTPGQYAYRCLPLLMANQAGWVITSPVGFSACWNGETHPQSLTFAFDESPEVFSKSIISHFGQGILTFGVPYLFRTETGISLIVRGQPNSPKPNATALEGLVETHWSPYSFTMNWKIQAPHSPVRFEKGEPVCFIQPVSVKLLEEIAPVETDLAADAGLAQQHEEWTRNRIAFNEEKAQTGGWQRHYFLGNTPQGGCAPDHKTALNLRPFTYQPPLEDPV